MPVLYEGVDSATDGDGVGAAVGVTDGNDVSAAVGVADGAVVADELGQL